MRAGGGPGEGRARKGWGWGGWGPGRVGLGRDEAWGGVRPGKGGAGEVWGQTGRGWGRARLGRDEVWGGVGLGEGRPVGQGLWGHGAWVLGTWGSVTLPFLGSSYDRQSLCQALGSCWAPAENKAAWFFFDLLPPRLMRGWRVCSNGPDRVEVPWGRKGCLEWVAGQGHFQRRGRCWARGRQGLFLGEA